VPEKSEATFEEEVFMRGGVVVLLGWFAGAWVVLPADSQDTVAREVANYPSRPVRIIVPQSPGGSTDLTARMVAQRLTEAFRHTAVVDNRPGAGSTSGTEIAARAAPDGHTLLVVASSLTINASLFKNLPYDPIRDFAAITQLSRFPNVFAAHPSLPAKTLADMIALAKAKPGALNYASAGAGTGTHMSAELLRQMTGIDIVQVPFKGGGPAVIATIGGQTQLIVGTSVGTLPHVRSGKLRGLAVTSAKRSAAAPDIPAIAETVPGYEHEPWNGLLAPARTPPGIINKIHAEVVRMLATPEVRKVFANEAAEAGSTTPQEFAAIIRSESAKWAGVVKAGGIKLE
jgi:tripartite-type tricarboxylate transporter receptor subunit TctC